MPTPTSARHLAEQSVIIKRCPLCSGTSSSVVAAFPELTWARCTCGLIYKRSQSASDKPRRPSGDTGFKPGASRRPYTTRTRRRIAKSRHQILDLLNHVAPGPLLDIGCSLGYTLVAADRLGLTPTGVDISSRAVDACRAMGFSAERCTLEKLPFDDDSFQLIVMKHVLEHTPSPRAALAEVRRILRPTGGLFVAVPDATNRKATRNPQTSRHYLPGVHGRQHFVDYTPATLSRLLSEEGFTVVKLHPHLIHRRADFVTRSTQRAFAPLRGLAQVVANGLSLRKEFWLVAVQGATCD